MRFNEKLQYLRKEKKLSQEQLADMLDVTRQSVSKWESGTTYPEMDKLIMLCKIFKCSLDDLTNDDITDVNVEKKDASPFSLNNILDAFLGFIEKTVKMFQAMSFKQSVGCIFGLLGLAALLMVIFIPCELLKGFITDSIYTFGTNRFTSFIGVSFSSIISIIFIALYIIIYIHVFKIAYLDKYEFVTEDEVKIESNELNENSEEKAKTKKETIREIKIVKSSSAPKDNVLFKVLGGIALGFLKFLAACSALPVIILLVIACFFLAIDVSLIIDGVVFIGVLLLIISVIIASAWYLELVSIAIFNRKASFKRLLWTFISLLVLSGLSFGITVLEVSNLDYIPKTSESLNIELIHDEKSFEMKPEFYLEPYIFGDIRYIEDENMGNKVKVEVDYFKDFTYLEINQIGNEIHIERRYYSNEFNAMKRILKDIKEHLKDGQVYEYDDVYSTKISITASKANLNKILENTRKYNAQQITSSCDGTIENYRDSIDEYLNQIDNLEEKNRELKDRIDELEAYKDRISSILDE